MRREGDFYPTPDALALACVQRILPYIHSDTPRVLEPSCGDGAFIRAIRSLVPGAHIVANDIDARHEGAAMRSGADRFVVGPCHSQMVRDARPDVIVGNPPYSLAEEHVRTAISAWDGTTVAFLLPLTFLGGKRRNAGLFVDEPLTGVAAVCPRPSFTGDGKTAATEYGMFVWARGCPSFVGPAIHWVPDGR